MPAPTPGKYTHSLTVRNEDIDDQDHVNNVVYIRWVQEVAEAHWLSVAPRELRQRYRWVVLRHEIDYKYPVRFGDAVSGTTWVGQHHGPKFERFVRIQSSVTTTLYAEARTMWCLLDARTNRPLRIPAEVLNLL